jgi:hypothetical protein
MSERSLSIVDGGRRHARIQVERLLELADEAGEQTIRFAKSTRGGNSPRNKERVRIISGNPSLMGKCVGAGDWIGQWAFEVTVDDARRWLKGLKK